MAKKRSRSETRRDTVATRSVPTYGTVLRPSPIKITLPTFKARAEPPRRGPLVTRPASYSSTAAKPSRSSTRSGPRAQLAKLYSSVTPELVVCAKRHIRKQVMHALGKSGKAGQRRPRYTAHSKVKCP